MSRARLRFAIAVLALGLLVAEPALAVTPPFNLQRQADGSLVATLGGQMKIWCDRRRRQLIFDYFENEVRVTSADELGFIANPFAERGERTESIEMKVALVSPGHLRGRAPVDGKLFRILEAEDMAVIAPNAMGEPWYTGRSDALIRVARSCHA